MLTAERPLLRVGSTRTVQPKHLTRAATRSHTWLPIRQAGSAARQVVASSKPADDEQEPDWDAEMSIFKQRMMRPNQLAMLRELEGRVKMGKVLYCQDSLAIISGLNNDAPLGTKLAFVSGAVGTLMWHRSDNLVYALVLGGAADVSVGEAVECKIKGVLQVVDDAQGPTTRKDFDLVMAPALEGPCFGQVLDYLGRPLRLPGAPDSPAAAAGGRAADVASHQRPLLNQQVAMKNRGQITESLLTGVKGLDVLTPLGRGSGMLIIGPHASGKTTLALDAVLGQRNSGVKCIYAAVSQTPEQVAAMHRQLVAAGAAGTVAIVAAPPNAPLGERYAALCTACSIGERIRDEGGHALVVLDDLRPLLDVWESLVVALIRLGEQWMQAGLIKDANGRDVDLAPQTDQELVEHEGMLVTGAVAQRRGFFSTLFQRAAKLDVPGGSGSMTLLHTLTGSPATGVSRTADMSKYTTLTPLQREKIQAVFNQRRAAAEAESAAQGAVGGEMRTEAVEEFISIADGQVVLQPRPSTSGSTAAPYVVDPRLSVSRIGTRAYYKALEGLAAPVRGRKGRGGPMETAAAPHSLLPCSHAGCAWPQRCCDGQASRRKRAAVLPSLLAVLFSRCRVALMAWHGIVCVSPALSPAVHTPQGICWATGGTRSVRPPGTATHWGTHAVGRLSVAPPLPPLPAPLPETSSQGRCLSETSA